MMKKTITGIVIALLLTAAFAWHHWQMGRIIARAKNTDRRYFNEIIVREMPIKKNPIWMFLRYDQYNYRCEYYMPKSHGHPWSTQTYSEDSFSASTAKIEWANDHEATVFLDNYPILKCTDGWWVRAEKQNTEPAGGAHVLPGTGKTSAHP